MAITDPTDISGLRLWLDATSLTLSSGDPVESWTSSGGIAQTLTQATLSNRPTYVTAAAPSGGPVVRFDGTGDNLVSSQSSVAQTLFYVGTFGGEPGGVMLDGTSNTGRYALASDTGSAALYAYSYPWTLASWSGDRPYPFGVFTHVNDGSGSQARRDGTLEGTDARSMPSGCPMAS